MPDTSPPAWSGQMLVCSSDGRTLMAVRVGVGLHVMSDVSSLWKAIWNTLSGTYVPKHLESIGDSARATPPLLLHTLKCWRVQSSASCWPKAVHTTFLTAHKHECTVFAAETLELSERACTSVHCSCQFSPQLVPYNRLALNKLYLHHKSWNCTL